MTGGGNIHVPLPFFYKPNGSSDFCKPQVLQEALSKTLVQFYPMAGRLGRDENGRLEMLCNAEGVLWIEAETTSAMDDLDGLTPCSKLRKLVPTADYSGDISSCPLIMAQVSTTLKCGGVSLGIATHHTLTDGTTDFHFINSWSEMARGLPQISMPPLIDRTLLRARITQNQLNTLKAKSWEHGNKTNYSTYTILAAYIWRCATKARGLSYDQPTKLNMPINGLFAASLIALSGNLQSEPFVNTLERVHGTLKRMNNEYLRSALDYLETLPDITVAMRKLDNYQCPNLHINKWTRLSIYDADFGWGRPIHMGPANVVHEGKIYILQSPTDDGSLTVVACLQTAHMKLFEKHLYKGLKSFDKIKARY
ncbi:hypothetical protein V6Z11_D06G237300 [Gossypium hirsutum]